MQVHLGWDRPDLGALLFLAQSIKHKIVAEKFNIGNFHTAGSPLFFTLGEISSDLYRSVQCDIEKCGFDSLKLEQNRWKCDKLVYKQ